jgi:peroxiredoxin
MPTTPLCVGDPAPWFSATTGGNHPDAIAFDELAGRYIVLFFLGTAARPDVVEVLAALSPRIDLFDRKRVLFVGISNDPDDFTEGRVCQYHTGQLFLLDTSGMAAKQYGVADPAKAVVAAAIRPVAFILSPALQIIGVVPLADPAGLVGRVASLLSEIVANPPVADGTLPAFATGGSFVVGGSGVPPMAACLGRAWCRPVLPLRNLMALCRIISAVWLYYASVSGVDRNCRNCGDPISGDGVFCGCPKRARTDCAPGIRSRLLPPAGRPL